VRWYEILLFEILLFVASVEDDRKEMWRKPELQHNCSLTQHNKQTSREVNGGLQTYVSYSLPHPHFRSSILAGGCVISLSLLVGGCSQSFPSFIQ
jgi:hypothetical protein